MCLQSDPLAGNWIGLKVIGHFKDTFMAVCSTPSSPFNAPLDAATLAKFLLTVRKRRWWWWIYNMPIRSVMTTLAIILKSKICLEKTTECNLLLVMQCSAGNNLFRSRPYKTDFRVGLCTNCNTKRWDCKGDNNEWHHRWETGQGIFRM